MYSVVSKYQGSYAIIDSETNEVEAIREKDLLPLLYFGLNIEGVSYNSDGTLQETKEIYEFTEAELNATSEDDDEEEDDFDLDVDYEDDEDLDFEYEEDETGDGDDDYDESDFDVEQDDDNDIIEDIYEDEEDWEDIEIREESTVSKLYKMLSTEQEKLLKRYYLWYSQELFINARKDPTLGYKDKNRLAIKQSQLNSLRNSGGQWYYAGFVDTGYDGGGYCTLGHKLRYMHIAWDVTVSDLNETFFGENYDKDIEALLDEESCIIFGIKCISDFFEVDTDCTQALQRAQRDSLKDMELMYNQYKDDVVSEVIDSFKLMDEIVGTVKKRDKRGKLFGGKNFIPVFEKDGLVEFYEQFRSLNMPVPKSLIQELRDNLIGWKSHKFSGCIKYPNHDKFMITVERIFGNDFNKFKGELDSYYSEYSISQVQALLCVILQYECCGYYKYNADTNKDEGGRSQTAKYYLNELYKKAEAGFLDIAEYTLSSVKEVSDTLSKLSSYKDRVTTLLDTDFNYIKQFRGTSGYWDAKRSIKYLESIKYERVSIRSIPRGYRTLEKAVKFTEDLVTYFESLKREHEEKQRAIEEEKRRKEEEEKLEKEEKLRKAELSKNEVLDMERGKSDKLAEDDEVVSFLLSYDVSQYANIKDFGLACSIIDTVRTKGGIASSRQLWHLKKLYTEITGSETVGNVTEKFDLSKPEYEEYRKAIEYILKSDDNSTVKKICTTVSKSGTFTKKQQKYLDQAVFVYKSQV